MTHSIRWLVLAALLLIVPRAHAADGEGRFSIRGAGLLTCDIYVKEREQHSEIYYMIGGWLDGYITALNQFAPDTYDITSFESTELLTYLIDDFCRKNPKDRLFSVVNSIFLKLKKDRLRTGSILVTVKVGDRQVQLYREVLRRVQEQLKHRGLYQGQVDGEFEPQTQKSIASFQRQQKLNPTGFPDQKTLWRLLRAESGSG
jgi:hypothetical protein